MSIKLDRDQVTIRDVNIVDKDLAVYLNSSPDPDGDFIQLVLVGNKIRSSFQTTLETQNIRDAADDVVKAMEEKYLSMVRDFQDSISALLEKDKGVLALRIKEMANDEIRPLLDHSLGDLSSHNQKSPIHDLKLAMYKHINDFETRISDAVEDVKDLLEDDEGERGPAEGFDFEDKVHRLLMPIARTHGDTFLETGKKQSKSGSLVGDAVVEINPEYRKGKNLKVVWEMKSDKSYKMIRKVQDNAVNVEKIREELTRALDECKCNVGVFVLDNSELNLSVVPDWLELEGNKLLILVDENRPDPEMLNLAYLWSRWKSLANSEAQGLDVINPDEVEQQISKIRIRVNSCNSISRNLGTAKKLVGDAASEVRELRKEVRYLLVDLENLLQIDSQEIDENLDEEKEG